MSDSEGQSGWRPPNTPEEGFKYKEPERPRFSILAALLDLCAPVVVFLLLEPRLTVAFPLWERHITLVRLACLALYILLRSKRVILWALLMYQRFAPADMRNSCVFEPSCSEYMRLAIMKYGLAAGTCKGLRRLLRCHRPNGGPDEP